MFLHAHGKKIGEGCGAKLERPVAAAIRSKQREQGRRGDSNRAQ